MISTFLVDFQDSSRPQRQRYKLQHIFLSSITAFLSNTKSYRDISRFIKIPVVVLKEYFRLIWERPLGHTTIRNYILGFDIENLDSSLMFYTKKS